jgi:hypothetical protein
MKLRFQNKLKVTQRYRFEIIAFSFGLLAFIGASVYFNLGSTKETKAASTNETLSSGSFIINMGITPQTIANGLKPYGLVYDMIINYQVPVKWIINDSKIKDGTDFTYNSVDYKGGPFIIPAEFINPTVAARIAYWQTQGIQGIYTTSALTVPVCTTLTSFPWTMIDSTSSLQAILVSYFNNASIPSSAYSIGTPAGLTSCFDVWANPHGDPTWATHNYLYNFVTVNKSWIWAECHSVSMMEYCKSTTTPTQQLNFLSTTGLKCWGANKCGTNPETHIKNPSSPYTYYYPTDAVMQFMGNMHNACLAGSEQWYQPISSGQWNTTARRGVTTGSGTSPREGSVLVYGPAYGDPTNGWAMYIGGHSLDSGGTSIPDHVAGQRAFFNYLLLAGTYKRLNVTASIPTTLQSGQSDYVSSTVTTGTPPYTYNWTSSMGGTFSAPTASGGLYTAPIVVTDTVDIVRVTVTDQCGRVNFYYQMMNLTAPVVLPVKLLSFNAERKNNGVLMKWQTASEVNNDYFTISRSTNGTNFQTIGHVGGNGTISHASDYTFTDPEAPQSLVYYRLSQTDFNGTSETFPSVTVAPKKGTNDIAVYIHPNPFEDECSLKIFSKIDDSLTLTIYDMATRVVYSKTYEVDEGENEINIDASDFIQGNYFLNIRTNAGNKISQKLIKR